MKRQVYIFALILIWIILVSCSDTKYDTLDNIQQIDMKSIPEKDFDDYVDELTCIPLSKSANGIRDCWKLIAYKEYFYLYSLSDFAVLIYTQNGNLIKRIDGRGKGKIETPTDILINRQQDELWICDSGKELVKYDLCGNFIERVSLPTLCIKMEFVQEKALLTYADFFEQKDDYLFHSYTNEWHDKRDFILKEGVTNAPTSYPPSLFAQDWQTQTIYALLRLKGLIYIYQNTQLSPFLYLDFGNDLLTIDKYPRQGFSDEQMDDIINNKRYIHTLNAFHVINGKMFFKTEGKDAYYYLISLHDKRHGRKFISLFDGFQPKTSNPIVGSDAQYLYIVASKEDLLTHYQNRACHYSSVRNILSSKLPVDGIIIRIKLKSKCI